MVELAEVAFLKPLITEGLKNSNTFFKKSVKKLKGLYKMKGMKKLMDLQDELDDVQSKFVEVLFEAATSPK